MQSWQGEGWLSDVFHVLEQKLREDPKQAMLCITNDASELPTCLEITAGDSESRVTVICSTAEAETPYHSRLKLAIHVARPQSALSCHIST